MRAPSIVDLFIVSAWQLGVCWIVRASGFRAISDDDYARVVIAAEFVNNPSWDPSGTSWLPFPFLLNGSAMTVFGDDLAVARGVAIVTAVLTACLLYSAARMLGASRLWAVLGTLSSSALAYSALLSVSTVPEYLCAGCLVFAASTLTVRTAGLRMLGALAVLVACASRYEAWPVAGGFALLNLFDAWKCPSAQDRSGYIIPAALAVAFPLNWLAYGAVHHGNPLFFVSRVVDYKRSLGDALPSLWQLASETPRALLFAEPEPVLAALAAWFFARRVVSRERARLSLWRAWFPLALMVITLIVGAARGGAPTHHSERALLACWLLFTLSAATWLSTATRENATTKTQRRSVFVAVALAIGLGAGLRYSNFMFERQPVINRLEEESIGIELKHRELTSPIALRTPDYGYFAIIATAGQPENFEILERHDPREHKSSSQDPLEAWLQAGGCVYVSDKARAEKQGPPLFSTDRLAIRRSSTCRE